MIGKNGVGKRSSILEIGPLFPLILVALAASSLTAVAEDTAEDWVAKGQELMMNGSLEEAIAAYDRAIDLDPDDAEAWVGRGYAQSRLAFLAEEPAMYNESLLSFERAIELNRSYSSAWSGKSYVLSIMERYDEAIEAYDASLEMDPQQPWVLVGKANALWKLGRQNESMEAYDAAVDAASEDVEKAFVWFERAHLFAEEGDYNETMKALERAIELAPEDKNFWINGGVLLSAHLGRYEEALIYFDKGLQIDPEDVDAWFSKGSVLLTMERYDDALTSLDEVTDLDPNRSEAWYKKGQALEALGRSDEADLAFERARELGFEVAPSSSLALKNVVSVGEDEFIEMANDGDETEIFEGLILTIDGAESVVIPDFTLDPGERIRFHLGEGESNETDVFLKSDLDLDDISGNLTLRDSTGTLDKFAAYWTPEKTSEYWIEKGQQLQSAESYEDALDALNNATDIDPQSAMAWFTKAQILGQNLGRYNESLEACEKAIEIEPENPDSWQLRGLILMNLGRDEEALAAFEEAIDIDPQNGRSWYLKGNLLRYLGRDTEAEEAFERAEELGFTSPLAGMIAITEIVATGEDELIEITNNLDEAKDLKGWTLVVDEDETRSLILPEHVLEPGENVRVHFGSGEETGTDLFMESEIVLNDAATSVTLRDEAGRVVSFLGFETLPDGGVAMTRGSGFEDRPS